MFKRLLNKAMGRKPDPPLTPPPPPPEGSDPSEESSPNLPVALSRNSSSSVTSSIESEIAQTVSSELELDLEIEYGAGKGWPTNASNVLYHAKKGVVVVGTEVGALFV